MWLRFMRGGPSKWYARTPEGEYAYGEGQGLYEWHHRAPDGTLTRTQYTGADRQCSLAGSHGLWKASATSRHNLANALGAQEALRAYYFPTN